MRRISRWFTHRSFAGSFALAAGALALSGFIRISFNPGSPDFGWRGFPVTFVLSDAGSRDVSDASDEAALRLAFQSWSRSTAGNVQLVEDSAGDRSRRDYTATDVHLVFFDEDGSTGLFPEGSGIVALTPIVAQISDGAIVDADIVFNGRDHAFSTRGSRVAFDVQAIATHEVGHFLGLDHSGGPRSTMFQAVELGATHPRAIKRDEEAFLASAYPRDASAGSIAGTITKAGGSGVAFGYVAAVDAQTGEYAGGTTTDGLGNYRLRGLRPGAYALYVEPLDGPVFPASTTRLASATADVQFATTWFPTGPVNVSSGGETSGVSWSAGPATALNVDDSDQGDVVAGGPTAFVTCAGAGMGTIVAASVPGTGVRVTAVNRASFNGSPAVSVGLVADANAPRGVRPLELRDAQGRLVILTAGIRVLDPAPSIARVTPSTLGSEGGTFQIDGTGFLTPLSVVVGGQVATDVHVVGGALVTATAPRAITAGVPVDVVVICPDGQEARATGAVTFSASPLPTSVDPGVGPLAGGTRHRIVGSGFAAPASVLVGNAPATTVSFVSATAIDFTLPPADQPGVVDVTVVSGGASRTLPRAFTYVAGSAPTITALSPTAGPAAGGTIVTIDGRDLPSAARVTFGGVASSGVTFVSPTRLTVATPPHAAGTAEVRVTDPATGLTGIAPAPFTYEGSAATVAFAGGGGGGGGGCAVAPLASTPGSLAPLAVAAVLLLLRRTREAPRVA